jgi:hypothetical protein
VAGIHRAANSRAARAVHKGSIQEALASDVGAGAAYYFAMLETDAEGFVLPEELRSRCGRTSMQTSRTASTIIDMDEPGPPRGSGAGAADAVAAAAAAAPAPAKPSSNGAAAPASGSLDRGSAGPPAGGSLPRISSGALAGDDKEAAAPRGAAAQPHGCCNCVIS